MALEQDVKISAHMLKLQQSLTLTIELYIISSFSTLAQQLSHSLAFCSFSSRHLHIYIYYFSKIIQYTGMKQYSYTLQINTTSVFQFKTERCLGKLVHFSRRMKQMNHTIYPFLTALWVKIISLIGESVVQNKENLPHGIRMQKLGSLLMFQPRF